MNGITDSADTDLGKLREMKVRDRRPGALCGPHGRRESGTTEQLNSNNDAGGAAV